MLKTIRILRANVTLFLALILVGCVADGTSTSSSSASSSSSGRSSSSSGSSSSSSSSSSSGGMVINEAVSSNAEFEDEDGDAEDWVELHNTGTTALQLAGWSLSDDVQSPQKWLFPDISIPADGYLVVWASDKNRAVRGSPLHANFKISASGETLYLFDNRGAQKHTLAIAGLRTGTSVGLSRINKALVYFDQPTPGAVNSAQEYRGVVNSTVSFSNQGGITKTSMVMLSGATANQSIRYTTDGSVPSQSSALYQGAIMLPKNTAIRARIFADQHIPSIIQSRTFLVNASHDIPVVTLEANPPDFFDTDYGIYALGTNYEREPPNLGANFWQDWERDIHFGFYEADGKLGIEFNTGVKIFGGYTRSFAQKALAFFARGRYGVDKFEYRFFPGLDYEEFEGLVLRASGNDWLRTMLRDRAFTSLMAGSGLDYQAGRAVAVYLNGEYWGLYNLREKVNEDFLATKHGVKKSQVTILEANAEVVEGSNEEYLALINYVSTTNPTAADFYATVSAQMDIDNFIAYQVIQIFIANEDWPDRNIKFWKSPQTKWRWILFDTDFGFGLYENNVSKNTIAHATAANSTVGTNPPWSTLLLRRLLMNPQFKVKFINYFADQLNSRFLPANVAAVIEPLADEIRSEIPQQRERWAGRNWDWESEVRSLITYANNRPTYVWQHLRSQFALTAPVTLSIEVLDRAAGSVRVNSLDITQTPWSGRYFADVPVTITAIPKAGYRFARWSGASTSTQASLQLSITRATSLTPVFVAN